MGRVVYIAHPVSGDVDGNIKSILKICNDIHKADNDIVPFAPYLVSLKYLDNDVVEEREMGVQVNIEFFERRTMQEVWLCGSSISPGMVQEIKLAKQFNIPIICYNEDLQESFDNL